MVCIFELIFLTSEMHKFFRSLSPKKISLIAIKLWAYASEKNKLLIWPATLLTTEVSAIYKFKVVHVNNYWKAWSCVYTGHIYFTIH